MTKLFTVAVALLIAAGTVSAQTKQQDHSAHHPEGVASAAAVTKASAIGSAVAKDAKDVDMAAKMKAMQDMHQKMMDAKTPEERQALMGEHMLAMQGGMGMMKQMSGKAGGADGMKKGMPADPKARMQAMEQRMDMMQTMMEMMADRMPAAPALGSK